MPGIREKRRLPYSQEQMFDLVADVGNYGKFLPWVVATRVRSDSETEMVADMLVGFKAIREKFTSRVLKQRPDHIEVIYVDGPLKDLDNNWTFSPTEDGGCEIDFCVDFTFRNAVFEA
ncbi:MAG TPA: ubiquinone-binding protein, partial [Erythrobacter sp.]|nr:ubiquinone-binding protein [Erythrobacter sp.]